MSTGTPSDRTAFNQMITGEIMALNKAQKSLYIEPQNEPNGEGNGWHKCRRIDATAWVVADDDQIYESRPTHSEAKTALANVRKDFTNAAI